MVKTTKSVFILLMLIAFINVTSSAQEQLVRVAGDPYPPWTLGEAGSKAAGGIAVEIVEELFRRLGMDSLVFVYPFKRGLERIKYGEEDMILMVSRSKEREEYMLFSHPIRHVKFVFYHTSKLENFEWNDWADLQPYRIGSVTGYNIGEDWKQAIDKYNLQVEEVKTDIFNIDKLLLGRLDIVVTDHEVMQRIIEENPKYQGKLYWHDKPVFESVNNFGVSKKSFLAPMVPKINQMVQEMKDDGTFQRIFCSHNKTYKGSCGNT